MILAHGHGYPQSGHVIHCDGAHGVTLPRLSRVRFLNTPEPFTLQQEASADENGRFALVLNRPAEVVDNELVTV